MAIIKNSRDLALQAESNRVISASVENTAVGGSSFINTGGNILPNTISILAVTKGYTIAHTTVWEYKLSTSDTWSTITITQGTVTGDTLTITKEQYSATIGISAYVDYRSTVSEYLHTSSTNIYTINYIINGVTSTIRYIQTSAPVIYKQAATASADGAHSGITATAVKVVGGVTVASDAYLTITANGDTEATTATLGTLSVSPVPTAGKTSYTIKMYNQATVLGATLYDTEIVPVVFSGGTSITVNLSNDSHVIPCSSTGTNSDYTGSGTNIQVWQGSTLLTYVTTLGSTKGTYSISIGTGVGITSGTTSGTGTTTAVVSNHSGTSTSKTASIEYTINVYSLDTTIITTKKSQTFSRTYAGLGISSIVETYQKHSSGTTAPTGTWSPSIPTLDVTNKYLWTKEVITYTDTTTYVITKLIGTLGDNGRGISSVANTYQIHNSGTTAPIGTWGIAIPATTDINKYLWNREVITYTDATTDTFYYMISQKGDTGTSGTRTAVLDMYQWAVSAPITFPDGPSTYTWSSGQFTLPGILNGWTITPSNAVLGQTLWIVRMVYVDNLATLTTDIIWTTRQAIPISASGTNGSRTGVLEVYRWATVKPTTYPSGTSTYTWATGAFTAPTTANSWELIPGAPSSGQILWGIEVVVVDTLTTDTSSVTWNSTTVYAVGASGNQGNDSTIPGPKSITISCFQWIAGATTVPTQAFVYTWSTGGVSAYPTGYAASATVAPGSGYTLYQLNLIITAPYADTTTSTNWSGATKNSIGYRNDGNDAIGIQGNNARMMYAKAASATTFTQGSTVDTSGGTSFPSTGNNFGVSGLTWQASPPTIIAGEALFQSDGIYITNGNTTWQTPYLSNLKVGSLSAISANLGVVNIATAGNLYSGKASSGDTTAGFFLGNEGGVPKISIGNPTNSLVWNGSSLTVTGTINASAGTFGGTLSGTAIINGITASTVTSNAAAGATANSTLVNYSTVVANASAGAGVASTYATDLSAKLSKVGSQTLTGPIQLSAANALYVGDVTNGIYVGNTGIIGRKGGQVTFSISGTGDAIFKGDITGASGTFGGTLAVGTSPAISGTAMTGSGAVINTDGSFALGNSSGSMVFTGSALNFNGIFSSSVNATGASGATYPSGLAYTTIVATCSSGITTTTVANLLVVSDITFYIGDAQDGNTISKHYCQVELQLNGVQIASTEFYLPVVAGPTIKLVWDTRSMTGVKSSAPAGTYTVSILAYISPRNWDLGSVNFSSSTTAYVNVKTSIMENKI